MIVPSIDLMDGHAVQLVGGREKAIDAGDPRPIAERFALAGEIAVIDLDAALGQGSNADVIEDLLRIGRCRVGGGIRDVESARRWLDAGAAKERTFNKYAEKGLRALKAFDNITKPWVARAKMKPKVVAALRNGLVNLKDKMILVTLGKSLSGFEEDVSDSTYDFVRQGIKNSTKFFDVTTDNFTRQGGKKVAGKQPRTD